MWSRVKLYQVFHEPNQSSSLELLEVATARLLKEMLQDEHCYILDTVTEMFVWTGKKAPAAVKTGSIKLAKELYSNR